MHNDLLLEIFTEELPAKGLAKLSQQLADNIVLEINKAQLSFREYNVYATPRRLAVYIKDLLLQQPDYIVEKRGPAVQAAFDNNHQPTKAALGFARSCGVEMEQLQTTTTAQGSWLVFREEVAGKQAAELLPAIIQQAIKSLSLPKTMRWGNGEQAFLRPVHSVVLMLGSRVVPATLFGTTTQDKTHGHRFHYPFPIEITEPAHYLELLKNNGYVIADINERCQLITAEVQRLAHSKGGIAEPDADLINEVAGLVEWPVGLIGSFDQRFLQLPREVVSTTLRDNQKSFAVLTKDNKLLPYFITFANIESTDTAEVIKGNERVVRARLSDAEFFYTSDYKVPLVQRLEKLKSVLFQHKLGSLYDKTQRITALAEKIADILHIDKNKMARAAQLAKTDLVTSMVGEFPELQGVMGHYYALHDGESADVAIALQEQYLPRFAGDELPHTQMGYTLALADRLDTLIGIFGINQIPTGDKDPFGLRRAALGVLRILIERKLPLNLYELLENAASQYSANPLQNQEAVKQAFEFIMERLRTWYLDQNIGADVFAAVQAKMPQSPLDFHLRIQAVKEFRELPEAKALAAANKRVSNLLLKEGAEIKIQPVDAQLLVETSEQALQLAVATKIEHISPYLNAANYTAALVSLADLQGPVNNFFDHVMVMVDDQKLRENRIRLLAQLRNLFLNIADISLLQ